MRAARVIFDLLAVGRLIDLAGPPREAGQLTTAIGAVALLFGALLGGLALVSLVLGLWAWWLTRRLMARR